MIGECWPVTHEVVNRKLDVRVTRSLVQGRFENRNREAARGAGRGRRSRRVSSTVV